MVKVCAFLVAVCLVSPLAAVEVFFDGSNNIDFDDLAGNEIQVGRFMWSDLGSSNFSNVAPAPVVTTDGWYLNRVIHDQAQLFTGLDTRVCCGTGGEQSFTWSTTISKIGSGRQIGGILPSHALSYGGGWEQTTTIGGGLGVDVFTAANLNRTIGSAIRFAPQDSIDVTMDLEIVETAADGLRMIVLPAPSLNGVTSIVTGKQVWDGVFGGIGVDGGMDISFYDVLTPGTLTVTPTIVPTSELSQSVIDSLPFDPGETFQSYDFEYTGTLGQLDGYIADVYLKYDPEELGILPQNLRIFHQTDEGEWYTIIPTVHEDFHLIRWQTDSFSSFALGELLVPEPSTGWLLLLGVPWLRRRKYGGKPNTL